MHCATHRLNLALSSSLSISSVRNNLGVIKDIINLFRNNALAGKVLKNVILKYTPESKRTRLVGLCKTCFIERHDTINVFVELFQSIIVSLHKTTRSVSSSASSLLASVEESSFIIFLLICENILSFTLPYQNIFRIHLVIFHLQ